MEKFLPKIQKLGNVLQAQVLGETGEVAVIGVRSSHSDLAADFTSDPDKLVAGAEETQGGQLTRRR